MYFDNFQSAEEPHSVRALSTVGRSDEDLLSEVLKRDRGINSQWEICCVTQGTQTGAL